MEIRLNETALSDLEYWKKTKNQKVLERIRQLFSSIQETPFSGIGKPEPLKYQLSGKWSRRIDQKNRIVYEVNANLILVYSLKGHY
jgi:toxin YoeB